MGEPASPLDADAAALVVGSGPDAPGWDPRGSLVRARQARKQSEEELRALENRVLLLRKEEERARQRIQQTKKRAEEILRMREENLRRKKILERERARVTLDTDPEAVKQRFLEKELRKAKHRKNIKNAYDEKRDNAQKFRSEKKQFERNLTIQKRVSQEEARRKREQIRSEHEEALRKLHAEREKKRKDARTEYNRKIKAEIQVIRTCQTKGERLEQLEAELIARLNHTQEVQHRAYKELEEALMRRGKSQASSHGSSPQQSTALP